MLSQKLALKVLYSTEKSVFKMLNYASQSMSTYLETIIFAREAVRICDGLQWGDELMKHPDMIFFPMDNIFFHHTRLRATLYLQWITSAPHYYGLYGEINQMGTA